MSRLQTWDDQVKQVKSSGNHSPAPVVIDPEPAATDPALLALLERIAVSSERALRRVAVIEMVMVLPIIIPVIFGLLILWGIRP